MYQTQPQVYVTLAQPVERQWRHSLCDCVSEMDVCCEALWFPCCNIARQWDAAEGRPDSSNAVICLANTCCGCLYCTTVALRCKVAGRYNLSENGCQSCMAASFCPLCSTVQTYRELNSRGSYPGGTSCCTPVPKVANLSFYPPPIVTAVVVPQPNGRYGATM